MSKGFGAARNAWTSPGVSVQRQRRQPTRFDEEPSRSGVVHLVVARRLVDERRLIVVAGVERDRRGVVVETQVSVETVGEFRQPLA